jgi:hypothetical protein
MNSHTTYASVGLGGSLAVLIPWVAKAFLHVDMPPEAAVDLSTLLSGGLGYFLHKTDLVNTGEAK